MFQKKNRNRKRNMVPGSAENLSNIIQMMKNIPGPFAPPFLSRPSRKITDRSYSATTLMQVHNEKGSVMNRRRPARQVKMKAQNPGPSGSAETLKEDLLLSPP